MLLSNGAAVASRSRLTRARPMRHKRMVVLFAADGHACGHRRCLGGVHPTGMEQFVASMRREMDVPEQVEAYLVSQPEPKQADLRRLHAHILAEFPGCRLWFTDGTNADGKVVANPNIGYGAYTITYADGSSREFYSIGLSANTTGISVYVLGLDDKTYLARTYGGSIGKASVTGYCIKFRHLAVINVDVLQAAIQYGMSVHQAG